MSFIEVEVLKWGKHQRRDVKRPSWFALDNRILEDSKLFHLTDAEWKAFIYILCQASQKQSAKFELSLIHAERVCGIKKSVMISAISRLCAVGVTRTSRERHADVTPHYKTRQDKTEQDTTKTECRSGDRRRLFLDAWNEKVKSLPRVKVWTDSRDQAAKRIKPEDWPTICEKVEASDFLSGRSGRWTSCSIDWALNPKNATKILEGTYDNREANVLKIDVGDILRGGK